MTDIEETREERFARRCLEELHSREQKRVILQALRGRLDDVIDDALLHATELIHGALSNAGYLTRVEHLAAGGVLPTEGSMPLSTARKGGVPWERRQSKPSTPPKGSAGVPARTGAIGGTISHIEIISATPENREMIERLTLAAINRCTCGHQRGGHENARGGCRVCVCGQFSAGKGGPR